MTSPRKTAPSGENNAISQAEKSAAHRARSVDAVGFRDAERGFRLVGDEASGFIDPAYASRDRLLQGSNGQCSLSIHRISEEGVTSLPAMAPRGWRMAMPGAAWLHAALAGPPHVSCLRSRAQRATVPLC